MNSSVWFRTICSKNGLVLADNQLAALEKYAEFLLEWNQKINLISRRDEENFWSRHILGSLSILFHATFVEGARVIDIGTGGGLPGIPLAIMRADLRVTLLDSIRKKMTAVADMTERLGLAHVRVVTGRAEEINHQPGFHRQYDYVVARAVAPVADLVRWGKPFLADAAPSGGAAPDPRAIPPRRIVLLKGGDLAGEIEQAKVRTKPASITTTPLPVDGVDAASDLHDKKLIIIEP